MKATEISVKIADMPQFRALAGGIADALDQLAALTPDEADALPAPVRAAVGALTAACQASLTAGRPSGTAPEPAYQGRVIIEWPDTQPGHHAIPSWRVTAYDAETGECINGSVSAARIDVDPAGWVTAELTQLVGPDGQPVRDGVRDPATGKIPPAVLWLDGDGRPRTRTFRYLVSGMRVREDWRKP